MLSEHPNTPIVLPLDLSPQNPIKTLLVLLNPSFHLHKTMAATIARSILTVRSASSSYSFLSKRLLSSTSTIAKPPPLPGFARTTTVTRSTVSLSNLLRFAHPCAVRLNPVRCRVNRSGGSTYSPINSSSNFGERPPTELAPLFPGCDYEHWLIVMDKPGGEGASKQQMIDCYIQTLAKIVGSEEEAKKKIYNVSCERYFGFGCEIDEETSNKLEGLPGVLFVLPDSYVDAENKDYGVPLNPSDYLQLCEEEAKKKIYNVSCERYFGFGCEIDEETSNKLEGLPGVLFVLPDSYVDAENKDYGAELFVNGEIVQRSPERQRRVEPVPQQHRDRPRYNDRTRYARRRENMR
ncbi:unnamed protein product [Ilex paraguariensis]|uniref:MORF/ORRM1/DAG-like MORF domain-containing protein n=1 Tax=Ilex paraguariensis TaxID=185542 RepID=A0ABC8SYD3_9AQUA